MIRLFALTILLGGVVACSDSPGGTELAIHIENGYGVKNYVLTCDPSGGNVPDPDEVCKRLSRDADVILFTPPNNNLCAGGLFTIHVRVTGIYEGRAVDTEEADGCQGNVAAERLWQSTLSVPQAPF